MTTPEEQVARLLAISLDHPAWGCNRLANQLKLEGISISAPTIQNILNKHGFGTRYDRWLRLEQKVADEGIDLSDEQVRFIEKQNPQFRERHVESARPGELLSQDTFYVGHFKGVGKVYLHAVVDTYSSHAFGFLHTSKQPEAAVSVVHNDVVPFYKKHKLKLGALLTDNGTEFCGTPEHPYELYLALCEIEHRRTKVRRPQTNGFVERFNRTVKEEFFETVSSTREQLQEGQMAPLLQPGADASGLPQSGSKALRHHQRVPRNCQESCLRVHLKQLQTGTPIVT